MAAAEDRRGRRAARRGSMRAPRAPAARAARRASRSSSAASGISEGATADRDRRLPAAVTLAFAPYGDDLTRHGEQARDGRPRDAAADADGVARRTRQRSRARSTLAADAARRERSIALHWHMSRFSGYIGLTNFLGAQVHRRRGGAHADPAATSPSAASSSSTTAPRRASRVGDRRAAAGRADRARRPRARRAADSPTRSTGSSAAWKRSRAQRGFAIGVASALPAAIDRAHWRAGRGRLAERGDRLVPVATRSRRAERAMSR